MRRYVTRAVPAFLALALVPVAGGASAQEAEPASAIYVSMCPDPAVGGRCVDGAGEPQDTELTALSPDGSSRVVLTDNRAFEYQPVWSPDSTRMVFSVGRAAWDCDKAGLRAMDVDGGDLDTLTRRSYGCDIATDWSPTGRRFLFQKECSLCFETWWMSADGEHDERLSTEGKENDSDAYATRGHWVDGGKRVVYSGADYPRSYGVYRVNPDGTGRRRLTPRMYVYDLDVSPNGKLVAFAGMTIEEDPDRTIDVWVMRSDGSDLRRLTDDEPPEHGLEWSPDGATLVFVSGNQENRIVTVRRDGADYTVVEPVGMSEELFRRWDPHWSPDGTEIVFLGERFAMLSNDLEHAAYVVAADGSYYRRITEFEDGLLVWGWEPVAP